MEEGRKEENFIQKKNSLDAKFQANLRDKSAKKKKFKATLKQYVALLQNSDVSQFSEEEFECRLKLVKGYLMLKKYSQAYKFCDKIFTSDYYLLSPNDISTESLGQLLTFGIVSSHNCGKIDEFREYFLDFTERVVKDVNLESSNDEYPTFENVINNYMFKWPPEFRDYMLGNVHLLGELLDATPMREVEDLNMELTRMMGEAKQWGQVPSSDQFISLLPRIKHVIDTYQLAPSSSGSWFETSPFLGLFTGNGHLPVFTIFSRHIFDWFTTCTRWSHLMVGFSKELPRDVPMKVQVMEKGKGFNDVSVDRKEGDEAPFAEPLLMNVQSLSLFFYHGALMAYMWNQHLLKEENCVKNPTLNMTLSYENVIHITHLLKDAERLCLKDPKDYLFYLQTLCFFTEGNDVIDNYLDYRSTHDSFLAASRETDEDIGYLSVLKGGTLSNLGSSYFTVASNIISNKTMDIEDWPEFLKLSDLLQCKNLIQSGMRMLLTLEQMGFGGNSEKWSFDTLKFNGMLILGLLEDSPTMFKDLIEKQVELVRRGVEESSLTITTTDDQDGDGKMNQDEESLKYVIEKEDEDEEEEKNVDEIQKQQTSSFVSSKEDERENDQNLKNTNDSSCCPPLLESIENDF